jgi:mRNA interferase MazF
MKSPKRGEVWLVDLGMAAKVRPAVAIGLPFLRAGVFDAQNLITIPHAKLVRALGRLSDAQLGAVERVVCTWLGLPTTNPVD